MKRLIPLFLVCALLLGCAPGAEEGGYTFTDDLGRTVTVDSPERVACLLGSFADICPDADVNLIRGGQPVYYYMISAE